jgi:hypothetical protein
MQTVETPHDHEIGGLYRVRQMINAAAADFQNFRLPGDRQIVLTVDHRFALSYPTLVSAPSKKSFSNVSSPISVQTNSVAWRAATSHRPRARRSQGCPGRIRQTLHPRAGPSRPPPGWGGHRNARHWASVRSPLTAASATIALKAELRFRRGRLFMVSPVRGDHRRFQAETPLIALFKLAESAPFCALKLDLGGS